ncbi:MAG TPA: hypothetical protein PK788_07775 [Gemmatimonadaceae bacterium]|nr:hypothetical protein [Gemmatimonadaceae bacterium]
MKKADSSRLETLEALIAEKRRQETFLAKLEERRAGTPEHVFNRLRDEYLTKLTDAQVKAAAEAETLSGGLEDDDAALAEVEARLATLEEERIEMQLRAEVEEWDAKETQKKLTAMTASISMAEKERDARKAVAERTRALLAEARGGTPAAPQAAVPGSGAPPMRPTTAAMTGGPNFDELAFLNSVVGRGSTPSAPAPRESKPVVQPPEAKEIKEAPSAPNPAPAPRTPTPPPMPAAPAPAAAAAPVAERSPEPAKPAAEVPVPADATATAEPVQESVAPNIPPSPAPPPPAQPSLNLETPRPAVAPAESEADAEDADDESSAPSPLGKPTPRTSQQIKTLKCAECGSMNYPTEWYCERCGGELAAL